MAATRTPGKVTAPYTLSWIVLGFRKLWRGAAPERRRRLSTTGVRLSVCESGWRSSFVGVGLSIDELSKDCVQRGALEAVVRRRPDMLASRRWRGWPVDYGCCGVDAAAGCCGAQELGSVSWGASTGVAAMADGGFLATDAVIEPATMY